MHRSLLPRLLASGLVSARDLVELGASVMDIGRSHHVGLVQVGPARRWVAKRFRPPRGDHDGTLAREHAAHELAARLPALARILPRLVTQLDDDTLVVEVVEGETLWETGAPADPAAVPLAATALGELHRASRDLAADPVPVPWILRAMDPDAPPSVWEDAETTLREIGSRPRVVAGLRKLRATWRATAFIHGDAKLDNALRSSDGDVCFVDWELSGRGDPLWDLAGICLRPLYERAGTEPDVSRWWDDLLMVLAPGFEAHARARGERPDCAALVGMMGAWLLQTAAVQSAVDRPANGGHPPVVGAGCQLVADADALAVELDRRLG